MQSHFIVFLTSSFQRDLKRIPEQTRSKILQRVKRLETNPFGPSPKIKKLKGKGIGQWRLEVWPYRIRYDVIAHEVILYRVRHRKEIYQD